MTDPIRSDLASPVNASGAPFSGSGATDDQLRAAIYFAVGVSSESQDKAYTLSVAGTPYGAAILTPADNSGYSIGTIQTDLGQHYQPDKKMGENVPKDLVGAYQDWAGVNHKDWILSPQQEAQTISDLGRNGNAIRADGGRPIDQVVQSQLNEFIASNEGISWVHARDVDQINKLMEKAIAPLKDTSLYRQSSADDQIKLAAIVSKAYNQNETRSQPLISAIQQNKYHSIGDVGAAIGDLAPKRKGSQENYFESGREAALLGAETFIALQHASPANAMREPWGAVVANPLVNPTQLGANSEQPHFANQYATVKGVFVAPTQGRAFVEALEKGGSYNSGDPAKSNSRGFYAEGSDFVQWDKSGKGRAFVGSQWTEFSRSEIVLAPNKDHTLDVNINRGGETHSLLHVMHPSGHSRSQLLDHSSREAGMLRQGMHSESVRKLQTQLGELGYLDNVNAPDGKFGPNTAKAVQSFQHDHHLPEVGRAGPATQQAIQAGLAPLAEHNSGPLPAVPAMSSLTSAPGIDDPRSAFNANHTLYSKLQQRLPDASEERLLQFTAACHANKITGENLSGIHLDETNMKIGFHGSSFLSTPATVDLNTPPPQPQQAIQQIQQHDQQQAQMIGQIQAQNAQVNQQASQVQGPTPGGPSR